MPWGKGRTKHPFRAIKIPIFGPHRIKTMTMKPKEHCDKGGHPKDWETIRHFKPSEFDSPHVPGSGIHMRMNFVQKLDKARDIAGVPFVVTSGARTHEHNSSLRNASPNSAHLIAGSDLGRYDEAELEEVPEAADISTMGSRRRFVILKALIKAGFHRIGIGEDFIHVDDDAGKDPSVVWLY